MLPSRLPNLLRRCNPTLVCKRSGCSTAADALPPMSRHPLLLLPDRDPAYRNLFSPADRQLHRLHLPLIAGSFAVPATTPDGYLATADGPHGDDLRVLNPLTGALIAGFPRVPLDLRSPYKLINCDIKLARPYAKKLAVFLTSSDDPASAVAFLINNGTGLSFARPGDKSWTPINSTIQDCGCYHDVTLHKGRFYAIRQRGIVTAFDLSLSPPRVTHFPAPPLSGYFPSEDFVLSAYHLAETPDGSALLLLKRFSVDAPWGDLQLKVKVFRLDCGQWVEADSLGPRGTALFMGSKSVSTEDSPELNDGCVYGFGGGYSGGSLDERWETGREFLKKTWTYTLKDPEPFFPLVEPPQDQLDRVVPADDLDLGIVPVWFSPIFP